MLLIHPVRLASAIGTQCPTGDGTGQEALLEQLRLLTPRAAAAMDHNELDRGTFRDSFMAASGTSLQVRLANGHLTDTALVLAGFYAAGGEELITPVRVDKEYGIVHMGNAYCTDWATVTYESGFAVPVDTGPSDDVHPDPLYRVAQGVPEWLEGVVADLFVAYQRNNKLKPMAPSEYGFLPTINEGMLRSLRSRIYGRYMRMRAGPVWHTVHERTA